MSLKNNSYHKRWDIPKLNIHWWSMNHQLENANHTLCDYAYGIVTMAHYSGRFNNYILQISSVLTQSVTHYIPRVMMLPYSYANFVNDTFDIKSATDRWACVIPYDEHVIKEYKHRHLENSEPFLTSVNAIDAFYNRVQNMDDSFLSQLFLRPKDKIRFEVDAFISNKNLEKGYNAIHLRWLEGSCISRIKKCIEASDGCNRFVTFTENITASDVCTMSSFHVHMQLQIANTTHLPCFLATDGQRKNDILRLEKDFGCVRYSGENAHFVDLLLLIHSTTFVGNPASTLSVNVYNVRRKIHSLS